ncbi:MAG TPA: ATP-binding protein [Lachnospiraceae bacterium]|nr:ATP-binding protein [Lachnospiraceae bacterium]
MALTNSQYDAIRREYDAKQLKNRRILEERKQEVYTVCPAYEYTVNEVSRLSLEYGKKIIDGEPGSAQAYHKALAALSDKKINLLLQLGYPTDYLDPVYDCPDCQDTGYSSAQKCHCFEQKIINILFEQSNMQKILNSSHFSELSYEYYKGQDLQNFKKAVETSLDFIKNFAANDQSILFYGEVGTGKSFLSTCIASEILKQGYSVIYFSATNLFNMLARYTFDQNNKEMLYKTYEDLYNCDLVIVDDLGTEISNSFTNSQFFSFVNERILHQKPIIISTNLGLEDIKLRYSERIFSRLTSNFTFRKLSGPDIRALKTIK